MNSLFARQLAKATEADGNVDLDVLVRLVSSAYEQADQDRRRTDRSIALMIEELDQLNRGLERLVEERTATLRQREEELQAQNFRFDAALNNMSQALLMFDSSARLVISNYRYHEMYGLPPEVVQPGCRLRDLLQRRKDSGTFSEDPDRYIEHLISVIAEGKTWSQLMELPDGRTIAVLNHP
ncbi:MAG TPA: PAS-domain containing protein, partial [Xanthobacteraceae bacterium]